MRILISGNGVFILEGGLGWDELNTFLVSAAFIMVDFDLVSV